MNLEDALLRADEPRRPLDWRFRRAVALSKSAGRSRRPWPTDDKLICDYADMLYRLGEQESFPEMEKIRKKYPDLFRVHLTYATLNATELALTDALLLCRSVDPEMVQSQMCQTGMNEVQQDYYKKIFLDIQDRRQMTSFIAAQIMEPAKLRPTAAERSVQDDLERAEPVNSVVFGTFSSRALRVLRLVGFYSSPVVVELLYSGMLAETEPQGRKSATKYITQTYLTSIRSRGLMSAYLSNYTDEGVEMFMKMAYALATAETEESEFTLMKNIEDWVVATPGRIALPATIDVDYEPSTSTEVQIV